MAEIWSLEVENISAWSLETLVPGQQCYKDQEKHYFVFDNSIKHFVWRVLLSKNQIIAYLKEYFLVIYQYWKIFNNLTLSLLFTSIAFSLFFYFFSLSKFSKSRQAWSRQTEFDDEIDNFYDYRDEDWCTKPTIHNHQSICLEKVEPYDTVKL